MRFLSVADRELRAAARRSATYYVRWITGVAFFGLLIWLMWVFDALTNQRMVPEVLQVFSVLIFIYCLVIGTARTADCLSSEKREGTLGLLYLTNLNSVEIVAGKLCSHALATVYGLVAIFPIMALPLLMGGVTGEHFWRIVLALVNAILFSLAAGFAASAVCVRQFPAVSVATGAALMLGAGLLGAAGIVDAYRGAKWVVELLAVCCPLYPLLIADGSKMFGANHYWLSLSVVPGLSLTGLLLVAGLMSRTWRDRPKTARSWNIFKGRPREVRPGGNPVNPAFRRRLLDINPFYWLAGRSRISSPIFMAFVTVIVAVTAYVTTPFFGRLMRAGTYSPMVGSLFAWVWAAMAIHGLSLYYAAMVASQRLAEDKQAGALEMILCTPTTERSISRGLWLAFGRRMFFPAVICVLVHCFFIWQVMILGILDPPGQMVRGATPGELFWAALWNQPIRGRYPDWQFGFILQILLLILGLLFVVWITCGWVGRWLGLKMKHPGFAPMLTLTTIFAPPILVFSFLCYLADKLNLDRLPERQFLPMMAWVAFGLGVLHCACLCHWAAGRLRTELRSTVTSRFQPPSVRRRWRPSWRGILRLTVRATAVIVGLVLMVSGFYGYQNWRSRHAWKSFQAGVKQRGESLDVAKLLPDPVPDETNFARSAAFQKLLATRSKGLAKSLLQRKGLDAIFERYVSQPITFEWTVQRATPLVEYVTWIGGSPRLARNTNNAIVAPVLLSHWQPHEEILRDLATAARLPHFQISGIRDLSVVIRTPGDEVTLLTRLQVLYLLRASARIETAQSAAAGEDILTSLELTRLAEELPDAGTAVRVNAMLVRTCQPLWEGMVRHAWSEPQLAAFQMQLARFDLIRNFTNTAHRVVLAHLADWRAIAENPDRPREVLDAGGGRMSQSGWSSFPRAWWFDRCIQLYQVGVRAQGLVNPDNESIRWNYDWDAMRDLPLSDKAQQALMPSPYMGNTPNPNAAPCALTLLNQARLACALERFWLRQGKYPQWANELVPEYLDRIPHDAVSGRAMSYERTADDRYILRGVGANQINDRTKKTSDDWLWTWPTNSTPVLNTPAK